MSRSNSKNDKNIHNKYSYYNELGLLKKNSVFDLNNNVQQRQEKILEYALDIRKFEIQLYWERTKYFTSLISGSFGGYAIFASNILKIEDEEIKYSILLLLTFLGFILSLAWYLSNRGSKYWQENWERHVDVLEDDIIGSLYKTTLSFEDKDIFNPLKAYPFSVSKINQIISLISILAWSILFTNSWYQISSINLSLAWSLKLSMVLIYIFIRLSIYIYMQLPRLIKPKSFIEFCWLMIDIILIIYLVIKTHFIYKFISNYSIHYTINTIAPIALLLSIVIIFMYYTKGTSQDAKTRKIRFKKVNIE